MRFSFFSQKNAITRLTAKKSYVIIGVPMISLVIYTALFSTWSMPSPTQQTPSLALHKPKGKIILGAERINLIAQALKGQRVAVLVNQTSQVGKKRLVDTLLDRGVDIKKIFCPEHGCQGKADAGELVNNSIDTKTQLPLFSLYKKEKKITPKQLENIDIVVFDIQDVGVRFYTYISTLYYLMEACAQTNKTVMVLDRPNPNGEYIDGPILEPKFKSFVGMLPIPIAHGMTMGELAKMINGEGWLNNHLKVSLKIISMLNYTHSTPYTIPIPPSPNLITQNAIKWYPSLGLFEGTVISVARGTPFPFETIGNPDLPSNLPFHFTPQPIVGMAKAPKYAHITCHGLNLKNKQPKPEISLELLIYLYNLHPHKDAFFIPFFEKLAGTDKLQKKIQQGLSETEIKSSWKAGLDKFKKIRTRYLLYPD